MERTECNWREGKGQNRTGEGELVLHMKVFSPIIELHLTDSIDKKQSTQLRCLEPDLKTVAIRDRGHEANEGGQQLM